MTRAAIAVLAVGAVALVGTVVWVGRRKGDSLPEGWKPAGPAATDRMLRVRELAGYQ